MSFAVDVNNLLNQMIEEHPYLAEALASLGNSGMPKWKHGHSRWSYYPHPRKLFRYCYNIDPFIPDKNSQGKRWGAWVYKSTKQGWKLQKIRFFNTRRAAKSRARKWSQTVSNRIERNKVKA